MRIPVINVIRDGESEATTSYKVADYDVPKITGDQAEDRTDGAPYVKYVVVANGRVPLPFPPSKDHSGAERQRNHGFLPRPIRAGAIPWLLLPRSFDSELRLWLIRTHLSISGVP